MNNTQYYNMDKGIETIKYLDFSGLEKYDKLIKSYIVLANKTLTDNYISADVKLENSLKGYIDTKVDSKQDKIEDLETIRSGAAAGATALQEVPEDYITESELTDKNYTTTSQVENLIQNTVSTSTVSDSDIDDLFNI